MSEQKRLSESIEVQRKRTLIETVDAKIAVYDGDRYLFTLGVSSEFEKTEDYSRHVMHDAEMEYLLEKSQNWREKLQAPQTVKTEDELPHIDIHELECDVAWRSWKKDDRGQCRFPAEEGKAAWIKISNAGNTVLTLVKAMQRQNLEEVSLGLFEYKLSGEDFLQRRPLKKAEENDPHNKMAKNIQNVKEAGRKVTQ